MMKNSFSVHNMVTNLTEKYGAKFFALVFFMFSNLCFAQEEIVSNQLAENNTIQKSGKIYVSGDAVLSFTNDVVSNLSPENIIIQKNKDSHQFAVNNKPLKKKNVLSEGKAEKEKKADKIKKIAKEIPVKFHFQPNGNNGSFFGSQNPKTRNACPTYFEYSFDAKTIHQIVLVSNLGFAYQENTFYYNSNPSQFNFPNHYSVRPPPVLL